MGQVSSVRYGITKNLGNYESLRLDAEMAVGEGEEPAEVLQKLKAWLNDQIGGHDYLENVKQEAQSIKYELQKVKWKHDAALRSYKDIKAKWEEAKQILERNGITVTDEFPEIEEDKKDGEEGYF